MFSDVALEDKLARVNSVVHPYASDVVFYFLFRLRRMERAGEASPRAAEALAFLEKLGDASADRVATMNTRRRELLQERMNITREIKNETWGNQWGLSNEALMEIVAARAARLAQAKATGKADARNRTGAAS